MRFRPASLILSGLIGLALPWLLSLLPFASRFWGVSVVGAVGGLFLILSLRKRARPRLPWIGAWWATVAIVSLWIALASFSAELTKNLVLTVSIFGLALVLVIAVAFLASRRLDPAAPGLKRYFFPAVAALAASALLASPARRYEMPRAGREIAALAAGRDPAGCYEWVTRNIERRRAPFTDDALATLRRREATCGGMANLLHKMILLTGTPARIVHFSDARRIHTLVEYRDPELDSWVLLDPDKRLRGTDWGGVSGRDVVLEEESSVPPEWRGYDRLYIYVEGRGYRRVTADNLSEFY